MKNIIYSTTRQWNPGDEFIFMGVEYLLRKHYGRHNSLIFNRSPHVRPNFSSFRKHKIQRFLLKMLYKKMIDRDGFLDNSIKPYSSYENIDMVVFAGSPEWRGRNLTDLYKAIVSYDIPTLYLGIGSAGTINVAKFTSAEVAVLSNSKLIVCRDKYTREQLLQFKSMQLPCPALFCSPQTKKINGVKKIALIYGTKDAADHNNISEKTEEFMTDIYHKLIEKYSDQYHIEFVAHYIDELDNFYSKYPNQTIQYSYKSDEYLRIFGEFDLVIGHRVHGIGMCASLGIPGIMIAHDARSETVLGFLAEMVLTDSSFNEFEKVFLNVIKNIRDKNDALIKHKILIEKEYLELLASL